MSVVRTIEQDPGDVATAKFARRGACPTLAAPMETGDGLLVRLRPIAGSLTIAQLITLAQTAFQNGNGLLEITARGNLQIRGLKPGGVDRLAADIDAAGISIPAGPAIEISPLHGIDPEDVADGPAIEIMLRRELAPLLSSPLLAPKLSITVDGGGSFGLADVAADIRLIAFANRQWGVALGGNGKTDLPVAIGTAAEVIRAVGNILELLLSLGRHRRPRDIDSADLIAAFGQIKTIRYESQPSKGKALAGVHSLSDGAVVLGLIPQFGQMRSVNLIALLKEAAVLGASEIRLASGRGFFLVGLTLDAAIAVQRTASRYGFSADPDDLAGRISACAGAGACTSGFFDTKQLARKLIDTAAVLLDGSIALHLSGCAKGCAHSRRALTITGSPEGYGLVLDGLAGDAADQRIAGGGIDFAIEKLARLIGNNRRAGESAAACLKRLGKDGVAKALRQE